MLGKEESSHFGEKWNCKTFTFVGFLFQSLNYSSIVGGNCACKSNKLLIALSNTKHKASDCVITWPGHMGQTYWALVLECKTTGNTVAPMCGFWYPASPLDPVLSIPSSRRLQESARGERRLHASAFLRCFLTFSEDQNSPSRSHVLLGPKRHELVGYGGVF